MLQSSFNCTQVSGLTSLGQLTDPDLAAEELHLAAQDMGIQAANMGKGFEV